MSIDLVTPVQQIRGIGPKRAGLLRESNIHTVGDLLRYCPFRYEDRTEFRTIRSLSSDSAALVKAAVSKAGRVTVRRRGFSIVEVSVRDASGSVTVKFYNQPYLAQHFTPGKELILFGVPRKKAGTGSFEFVNPEFEVASSVDEAIHSGRIVPVYRRLGGLSTKTLRKLICDLLERLPDSLPDPLPEILRRKYRFPGLKDAFRSVHFPEAPASGDRLDFLGKLERSLTPAQQRFIFEELFLFQLGVLLVREKIRSEPKDRHLTVDSRIREQIRRILPFHPTVAQKRAVREIVEDLCSNRVMHRLLHGDVGSGKTIVALQAMVVVIENGFQAVLMNPTELLAEQQFQSLCRLLAGQPYRLALLTGNVKGQVRKSLLAEIEKGAVDIVVGTHALIEAPVRFKNLALVVVDEQHRFGVIQRSRLVEKGIRPDLLVMSATPIPRSLALTVFGDLDVSTIDRLPPGRKEVKTIIETDENRGEVYALLRQQLERGRQAYVVYPLVEESARQDLRDATRMARELQRIFSDYRIGLMHGRLSGKEKDALMNSFLTGRIDLLVSTTVIEVGIDVPNAALMLIEHAGRFGLSQLHQLRGRIGRGKHPGLCVLMADSSLTAEGRRRLEAMCETNDGFEIARLDLEIRGPGDFLGTRQSGTPEFKVSNLARDYRWLRLARREAESYVQRVQSDDAVSSLVERILASQGEWPSVFLGTG